MDEWLFKYINAFGDNFPTHAMMGKSEKEIVDIIKGCLENGAPYKEEESNNIY